MLNTFFKATGSLTIPFRTTVLAVFQTNTKSRRFCCQGGLIWSPHVLWFFFFSLHLWLKLSCHRQTCGTLSPPLHQYQISAQSVSLNDLHSAETAGARAGQRTSGNIVLNNCTLVYSLNTCHSLNLQRNFTAVAVLLPSSSFDIHDKSLPWGL